MSPIETAPPPDLVIASVYLDFSPGRRTPAVVCVPLVAVIVPEPMVAVSVNDVS